MIDVHNIIAAMLVSFVLSMSVLPAVAGGRPIPPPALPSTVSVLAVSALTSAHNPQEAAGS